MTALFSRHGSTVPVEAVDVQAYRLPTQDGPESDGTAKWSATTLVLVEVSAGSARGIGYTYADASAAMFVRDVLAPVVEGADALQTAACWSAMSAAVRNQGRQGLAAMAISAVDVALWDLRAKILEVPLCTLIGAARHEAPIYGSGGFTSYDDRQLREQMRGWVDDGIPRVKMKVGRHPDRDAARVELVRRAIGSDCELYVDANGAYSVKQATAFADLFASMGVIWFEEPVPHHDFEAMRRVRRRAPASMEIASGEYGYTPSYFVRMLQAGAVDVMQADGTRCGGITGLLAADAVAQAHGYELSTHCAPYLHLHAALACKSLRHCEYFFDHARMERLLFDGTGSPDGGALVPDLTRPGLGLEFKKPDAEQYLQ